MTSELDAKLALVREALTSSDLAAVRLRGTDWFAWATCGGSSVIDTSSERGVAEVLVTADNAVVLADRIDAARLRDEEIGGRLEVIETAWGMADERERVVRELVGSGAVSSDRPARGERELPGALALARRQLLPDEIERYRRLSRDAAAAATQVLKAALPDMTEADLAATASAELLGRGMHPVVILAGGEERLPRYRHPTPAGAPLGSRAMLVLCARRHGLIANLTRFVYFRQPTAHERQLTDLVARVEATAFDTSRAGARLASVFEAIVDAYREVGFAGAELDHHQGGPCGYSTREEVATAQSDSIIPDHSALAWNPSLTGAKVEDTVIVDGDSLEILTVDPEWPTVDYGGRPRPDLLLID